MEEGKASKTVFVKKEVNLSVTHNLKIESKHFYSVKIGIKKFEIRFNDRNYQVGDKLILNNWDKKNSVYLDGKIERTIIYMLQGTVYGLAEGYCVLGIDR